MRRILAALVTSLLLIAAAPAEHLRFLPLELVLHVDRPGLAAYQMELRYAPDQLYLVGIEGGDGVFAAAPYYDPRGLTGGRVIVAAFTTADTLPAGRVRVARLHLALRGDAGPDLTGELAVAATRGGERIDATWELVPMTGGEP